MMRLFILLFALLVGSAWASTPPVILVLGDSLSAGYGLDDDEGWVDLLQQRLTEEGYPHRVVNASISGETTSGGLQRLPRLLERHYPAQVVLELGGNDGLRGLSLEAMRENLATMIEHSRAAGARVVLVGMRMPPNYGPAYTRRFAAVYRELAGRYDVALVPFLLAGVAGDDSMMQPDRIHAAASAQPRILENVWAQLEPLLQRQAADVGAAARPAAPDHGG